MAPTVGQLPFLSVRGAYQPKTMFLLISQCLPIYLVASSVFRLLGIIITAWRIYFRLRIHRFWWEDAWAVLAMLFCLASLVGEWTYLLTYNLTSIVAFWFNTLGSVSVISATYLSVMFSIIRILPNTTLRRFTYLYAACCGLFWIVSISGKIWWCASNTSWHHHRPPACGVPSQIVIFEFTTDCLTVGILIAIPLRVLWRAKLPRRQRRMILSVFASSVMLAFAAIFHMIGDVLDIDVLMLAGQDFENACSIIVCNLLIIVTYMYRFFGRDGESSDATTSSETDFDDFTQSRRQSGRSPMTLTTVEIGSGTTQQHTYSSTSAQSSSSR